MGYITDAANFIRDALFNLYQEASTTNPGYLNRYIRTSLGVYVQTLDANGNPLAGVQVTLQLGYLVDQSGNPIPRTAGAISGPIAVIGQVGPFVTDSAGKALAIFTGSFDVRYTWWIGYSSSVSVQEPVTSGPVNPNAAPQWTTKVYTGTGSQLYSGNGAPGQPWPSGAYLDAVVNTSPPPVSATFVLTARDSSGNAKSGAQLYGFLTPAADWPPPSGSPPKGAPAWSPVILKGSEFSGTTASDGTLTEPIVTGLASDQSYTLVVQAGVTSYSSGAKTTTATYKGSDLSAAKSVALDVSV